MKLSKKEIEEGIEKTYNEMPKNKQTYKLFLFSQKCLEEFDRLIREKIKDKYYE